MFLNTSFKDKDVIEEHQEKNQKKRSEEFIHQWLKGCWSISEAKNASQGIHSGYHGYGRMSYEYLALSYGCDGIQPLDPT